MSEEINNIFSSIWSDGTVVTLYGATEREERVMRAECPSSATPRAPRASPFFEGRQAMQ